MHTLVDLLSGNEDRVIEPKHQQPIDPAVEGNPWVPIQHHLDDPAGEVRSSFGGRGNPPPKRGLIWMNSISPCGVKKHCTVMQPTAPGRASTTALAGRD